MDDVITRIVDIERQCSAAIEEAQLEYEKKIEAHKRLLEEKKSEESARIISAQKDRLTQAVETAKKQIEAASAAFINNNANLFQDPVLEGKDKRRYNFHPVRGLENDAKLCRCA